MAIFTLVFMIVGTAVGAVFALWCALDKKIDRPAERLDQKIDDKFDRLDKKVDDGFGKLAVHTAMMHRDIAVMAARREPTKVYRLPAS